MPRNANTPAALSVVMRSSAVVPPSNEPMVALAPSSRSVPGSGQTPPLKPKRKSPIKTDTKPSKRRTTAARIVALRIEGHTTDEIATILRIAPGSVKQYMYLAGKRGWLSSADPQEQVDFHLAHKAVKNLGELLAAKDKDTQLPLQDITVQTLKGVGIFRNHDAKPADVQSGQQNVLQINIQTPEGSVAVMRPGTMQGTPAFVEGEKVSDEGRQPGG